MLSARIVRLVAFATIFGLPGSVAMADASALSVQVVVTPEKSRLAYMNSSSHFHVVLKNTSAAPLRVWQDWNSWGYFALSFELSDNSGKHWAVGKNKQIIFTKNYPSFDTIDPRRAYVFDVHFGDADTWPEFPLKKGEEHTVSMRAVFEITDSLESKKQAVWVGRVVSDPVTVTFVR